MPSSKPNRLIEWYLLFKDEWLPAQGQHWREWWSAVKEEPGLAWETPALRYGVYGSVGLALLLMLSSLAAFITPPPPADARPQATTASFHVVCSKTDCRKHFLIERKFGFHKFPVPCPQCQGKTGLRGLRCASEECGGRYVGVREDKDRLVCTQCGEALAAAP